MVCVIDRECYEFRRSEQPVHTLYNLPYRQLSAGCKRTYEKSEETVVHNVERIISETITATFRCPGMKFQPVACEHVIIAN
jgi:hypothetical protein